jgi:nucleoid DNA-binding protein
MIKKYISELVSGNNRVIIPDFGAFMIQETPEGKVISFNYFLKFNDGLLVNHIIKNDKVNKNQALEQIKEFVKEIESSFNQGKTYVFEGMGELSKDPQGNIKLSTKVQLHPKQKR